MTPQVIYVVLNQHDYIMFTHPSKDAAEFQAAVFQSNNIRSGDKNAQHRVVCYKLENT